MVLCESARDTLFSFVRLVQDDGHSVEFDSFGGGPRFVHRKGLFTVPLKTDSKILVLDTSGSWPTVERSEEVNVLTRSMKQLLVEGPKELKDIVPIVPPEPEPDPPSIIPPSSMLSHLLYGHICGRKLDQLIENDGAEGLLIQQKRASHKQLVANCDACMLAKTKRKKFGDEIDHGALLPNDKVVGDVIGPINIEVKGKGSIAMPEREHETETSTPSTRLKFYISVLTDVFSRNISVKILDRKQPSDHVISYSHSSEFKSNQKLKHFHTDGGKEYNAAEKWLEAKGVKVTRTPPHTPQWNGIAERKNRTLVEMARAFLLHARLDPNLFWQYAVETAAFTHNRVTIVAKHGKTPHELFTGKKPDVSRFHIFGCDAFIPLLGPNVNSKMAAQGEQGIFVGYDPRHEGAWRIWIDGQIKISKDAKFRNEFTMAKRLEMGLVPPITGSIEEKSNSQMNSKNKPLNELVTVPSKLEDRIDQCFETSSESDQRGDDDDADDDMNNVNMNDDIDEFDPNGESKLDKATARQIAQAEKRLAGPSNSHSASTPTNSLPGHGTRKSSRISKPTRLTGLNPDDFGPSAFLITSAEPGADPSQSPIRASEVPIPSTRRQAMRSAHAEYWMAAEMNEMKSLQEHGTWEIIDRPTDSFNLVTCKWVYDVKVKNGIVQRFKARLVARGFTQEYGIDYEATYSSVVRFKAIRVLLALAASEDFELELMDVQTAYLNAPLKERVIMSQPEGYSEGGANQVCLLKKALYGLKQSGREWNQHLNQFLIHTAGFTPTPTDSCVYRRIGKRSGRPILLAIYVDDITSAFDRDDRAEWEEIKQQFSDQYKIKFLGEADWLLNMRITRDRSRRLLWLDQQAYIKEALEEFHLNEAHAFSHPGAQENLSHQQSPTTAEEREMMSTVPYRRVIGLLTYLANCTRPDISHAVNTVAQYSQNPGAAHWRAVKQILRYLAGTTQYGLLFDGSIHTTMTGGESFSPKLVGYSDANWAGCKDTRRSTTGWLIQIGRCWVDWCCQKQQCVALSSAESEYIALCSAAKGIIWIERLMNDIGFSHYGGDAESKSSLASSNSSIPTIHCDNKSAIAIGEKDSSHGRTKHIDTQYHFIREKIADRTLQVKWISTHDQMADILTKSLAPRIFHRFRDELVYPTSQTRVNTQSNTEEKSNQSINTQSHMGGTTTHTSDGSGLHGEREGSDASSIHH